MPQSTSQRLLLLGTILAYGLIGIEIIIMISPFALYFYSVYAPFLQGLSASPLTSWTTEFFLPHMVFLNDPLILAISYLQVLLVVGLVLFFTAAIPLYWGRFTGRGVVNFSFYAKIRHPQYLFLAISGFGLLLYWPRFIILMLYVTMLYIYYILARNEEWRMRHEAPNVYARYMERIPMFLPGEPGGRIFAALFGWLQPKWLAIAVSYLLAMVLAVLLAMSIRSYAVSRLPTVHTADGLTLVPVFERPAAEVNELYRRILITDEVRAFLAEQRTVNLAYIMPGDFFLTALVTDESRRFSDEVIQRFPEVLEWHQHKFKGGLGKFFRIFYNFIGTLGGIETDYDVDRFIFVAVTDRDGRAVPQSELFALGLKRTPALLVDYDHVAEQVVTVMRTTGEHKWGTIPMPTF
ncbi:MAG: methyltransferase family protein [Desulfobulbaceae bacterium]